MICKKCGNEFNLIKEYLSRKFGKNLCLECIRKTHNQYMKKYYATHPEVRRNQKEYQKSHMQAFLESCRKNYQKTKLRALNHYSNGELKCARCGSKENLSIDHIYGNGEAHRTKLGFNSSYQFYLWLIRNAFPEGYRVLCRKCNSKLQPHYRATPQKPTKRILEYLEKNGTSHMSTIGKELSNNKICEHSILACLSRAYKKGKILRIGRGLYQINNKYQHFCKTERKILDYLSQHHQGTWNEIRQKCQISSDGNLSLCLNRLCQKKRIIRVERGLYRKLVPFTHAYKTSHTLGLSLGNLTLITFAV